MDPRRLAYLLVGAFLVHLGARGINLARVDTGYGFELAAGLALVVVSMLAKP